MTGNSYESGRPDLRFVGISTFGKNPHVSDRDAIDADFAILDAPSDFGTQSAGSLTIGPHDPQWSKKWAK